MNVSVAASAPAGLKRAGSTLFVLGVPQLAYGGSVIAEVAGLLTAAAAANRRITPGADAEVAKNQKRTTSRRDLARNPRFEQISPEVGELNEDALIMWTDDVRSGAYARRLSAIAADLPEGVRPT